MLAARKHYEAAVALDPEFARAWGRLSQVSSSYYNNNGDSASFEIAQRAAARVLELDPKLPDAHLAMGNQYTLVRNNYRAAIAAYENGLALNPSHAELLSAIGLAEQALGNTEKAIDYMKRGLAVDPRSLVAARRLTRALTWAHRFEEAEVASRQALAISPIDASAVHYAALLKLAQGDLAGARSISRTVPRDSLPKKLAYWATYYPMNGWWLDDEYKANLARLSVTEYNDQDPSSRFGVLSALAYRRGDSRLARAYADSAFEFVKDLPRPDSVPGPHIVYAGALAQIGRFAEAIKEGEIAVAMRPNDYYVGANLRHNLIEICILAGDHQRALDHLEVLVRMPYYMTPAWLRIDPTLVPLRNEPRFKKLLEPR
jgi:tetratricopeptide (TPR) repeat protein